MPSTPRIETNLIPKSRQANLPPMQNFPSAPVRLLLMTLAFLQTSQYFAVAAAPAKVHVVALGAAKKVPWTPPASGASPGGADAVKAADELTMKVRPLTVDGR